MNFLRNLFILIVIGAIVAAYVIMPYINGMAGSYHAFTYVTRKVIIPKESNDWKNQVLCDCDKDENAVGNK